MGYPGYPFPGGIDSGRRGDWNDLFGPAKQLESIPSANAASSPGAPDPDFYTPIPHPGYLDPHTGARCGDYFYSPSFQHVSADLDGFPRADDNGHGDSHADGHTHTYNNPHTHDHAHPDAYADPAPTYLNPHRDACAAYGDANIGRLSIMINLLKKI